MLEFCWRRFTYHVSLSLKDFEMFGLSLNRDRRNKIEDGVKQTLVSHWHATIELSVSIIARRRLMGEVPC